MTYSSSVKLSLLTKKIAGVKIVYSFQSTQIGECLPPLTSRDICFLDFMNYNH
jgi:hypothetical protein